MHRTSRTATLALAIAAALSAGSASAAARIGSDLSAALQSASPWEPLQVVITWKDGPAGFGDLLGLRLLGVDAGVSFANIPVTGALATPLEVQRLAQRSDVLSVTLNKPLTWANADSRALSGVDSVQADPSLGFTGAGVTVVVNDSGIDATHGDLTFGDRVVENVQALTNLSAVIGGLPPTYLEGQPVTDISSGHGTHCAATVGGSGARSAGLHRGVATGADLVGYGSGAVISVLDALGGFDYAIANRDRFASPIRVISNSWGSSGAFDPTDPVVVASYEAYKQGIVTVFAAGNEGPAANTHNPYAQAPWVISVGAANKDRTLADFSSRGNPGESASFTMPDGSSWTYRNEPTLVATGVDVVSARALTGVLPVLAVGQDINLDPALIPFYTHMSGTSMATPHVAGIVALLFEANPALTPAEVRDILTATADPIGLPSWEAGAGHVDAYEAVVVAAGQ